MQSLSYLDQVKQFILESGSVPDQGTKEASSYWYNPPHRGESIFSPDTSTFSDHLIITMVDIYPSGDMLPIIATSGSESSIRIDS